MYARGLRFPWVILVIMDSNVKNQAGPSKGPLDGIPRDAVSISPVSLISPLVRDLHSGYAENHRKTNMETMGKWRFTLWQ